MNFDRYQYVDLDAISEIADGDAEFIKEIIGNYVTTVSDSIQGLIDAVNNTNSEKVVFFAHKLKGSFSFVGATGLRALAIEIESNSLTVMELKTRINEMILLADKVDVELKSILDSL